VDHEGRRSSPRPAHRLAGALRGSPLRADVIVRRGRQAARLRLLYVPRQHRRARCADRRRHLEELHDPGAAAVAPAVCGRH
jgi:hypothetical protein